MYLETILSHVRLSLSKLAQRKLSQKVKSPTAVFQLISISYLIILSIMYLMKHLISTICSSHRNDHRTLSIDCDLHKLMNIILCELRNLKDLLSLSPLITINNILSGVLSIIAFYLIFYVAFFITSLLHRIVLYSVCMYRIVAIQPFGCNTVIKFFHSYIHLSILNGFL